MSIRLCLFVLSALVVLLVPHTARAQTDVDAIARLVPNAQAVGKGRLKFVFWDVYDIVLYAPQGKWRAKEPYALSLSYLRELSGEELAERSIEEIEEQGFKDKKRLALWQKQMNVLFPDVDEGTTLTGVRDKNGHAVFYSNGERLGIIKDKRFSYWFFGIWLGKKSTLPELRDQLLGRS